MNYIFILSFALMSSLNSWVKSEDFCQAFRGNNDRISYTYLYDRRPPTEERFIEVIINDKYWTLETTFNVDILKFVEGNHESQTDSNVFSGDYSIAMTVCKTNWKDCSVLLINTNSWKALVLISSFKDDMKTKNLKFEREVNFGGISGKPMMAFQTDYSGKRIFAEYNRTSGQLNATAYDMFAFDGNEITANKQTWDPKWSTFLNSNIGSMNLLSLINAYNRKIDNGFGYIVLFEMDALVKWCWVPNDKPGFDCKSEQVLVDCSSVPSAKTQKLPTSEQDNSWIINFIIVVCIVLIIILIVGFVYFVMNKKSKEQQKEQVDRSATGVSKMQVTTLSERSNHKTINKHSTAELSNVNPSKAKPSPVSKQ